MSFNPHMDAFMSAFPHEGLTFDDVTLVTRYADFLPDQTSIASRLTTHIALNMPFVSAAMDTVTEGQMAIAMAVLGGIGIIHKNLAPKVQVKHVDSVKHYLNGLIQDPIVFHDSDTLRTVEERKQRKGYGFSGFPILDEGGKLVGILTASDIKFAADPDARVTGLMTREVITAPPGTDLNEAYALMMKHKIGKLPLVQDGKLVGLYSFSDVRTLIRGAAPQYNRDAKYRLRVGAAVGVRPRATCGWAASSSHEQATAQATAAGRRAERKTLSIVGFLFPGS